MELLDESIITTYEMTPNNVTQAKLVICDTTAPTFQDQLLCGCSDDALMNQVTLKYAYVTFVRGKLGNIFIGMDQMNVFHGEGNYWSI